MHGRYEAEFEHAGLPVLRVNEGGQAPFVLLCEHASRLVPPGYGRLGLPRAEFDRHIAWDIGAAELAVRLALLLDAPLFLAGYSRLLIDLNRPPGSPGSIPELSDSTAVPGNIGISDEERRLRLESWFRPFHAAVAAHLDARRERATVVVGVHTFTPVYGGVPRPWQAGVLFRGAETFGRALAGAIEARCGTPVGRNEPYRITLDEDYTVPVHGDARGLAAALIEVRQDLVTDVLAVERWSRLLADALLSLDTALSPQANEPEIGFWN